MRLSVIFVVCSVVGLLAGCDRPSRAAASGPPAVAGKSAALSATAPMSKPGIAKIVFVGKQNACDCTRKTIDASWKALEAGLGAKNRIPVEHLKMDTQPDQVAVYRSRKPFMALPAIYFLDQADSLVELLQGEVTQEQVTKLVQ
jgi:hypothetical protein